MMNRISLLTCLAILAGPGANALDLHDLLNHRSFFANQESYRYGPAWDEDWQLRTNGIRTSAGSVSSKRFLLDVDVRLQADPAPWLRFGYRRHVQESYLEDREIHRADLALRRGRWLLGATGMVHGDKGKNVVGALLGLEQRRDRWIHGRWTWPGVYYNSKSQEEGKYRRTPMEVQLEGMWRVGSLTISGEGSVEREWELVGPEETNRGRSSQGHWTVIRSGGSARWALELHGRDHRSQIDRVDGVPREDESLRLLRLVLQREQDLTLQDRLTTRLVGVHLTGHGLDEPWPTDPDPPMRYRYRRHEELCTLEWTRRISPRQQGVLGLISGLGSVDPGTGRRLPSYQWNGRYLIKGEYLLAFPDRGDLIFLVSYDLGETNFGGGNVRLRFVL